MVKTINVEELKKRFVAGEVLLIDVREREEYQSASIEGAYLIPLAEISLEKLPSRSKPIVIHCRSGKRSVDACQKLLAQDPTCDVCSLEGGILAWHEAGFPVK